MTILAPIHTIKLTVEQYFQMGDDPPGTHFELVDGAVIVSPSPSRSHADIVFTLAYLLETHIRNHRLGGIYLDTDVVFSEHTARRPDIAYYPPATMAVLAPQRLTEIPDLCIEVLSPSNVNDDRINKFHLYQSSGVGHYWIIDPEEHSAEAYVLADGVFRPAGSGRNNEVVHFPPFMDLSIPLAELWAKLS